MSSKRVNQNNRLCYPLGLNARLTPKEFPQKIEMVRLKNRYIVLEVKSEFLQVLSQYDLHQTILTHIKNFHGDFGEAATRAGFSAKYTNPITKIAVIKCRFGPHNLVTSVLPFVRLIKTHPVSLSILYIGATMKNCFNFIKTYQERLCDELCIKIKSEEERREIINSLSNFKSVLDALK
ncbi:ribonuclease P/MRP protein subunit POP5 [Anthonomus grandis grandis]|uniref:ribonuclease P/MRP protein subunit POP5 n=1 Tax=Anthonomus grandis grandis TaxID=2921223 RepID=UPI002165FC30|nr:ribonuclease P/MRP protein subunit POP5 [Anthonomus grandis grandis]